MDVRFVDDGDKIFQLERAIVPRAVDVKSRGAWADGSSSQATLPWKAYSTKHKPFS